MHKLGRTAKILLGLLAGIGFGLFFGESCSILQPYSQAFVKILQITVLPFIVVNLVSGLGGMRSSEARTIAVKGGLIMILFWALGAITVFSMQFAFPRLTKASFFTTTETSNTASFNVVDVFIPYNPFHSLAEGSIPSIVLFCLLLGFAMIGIKKKKVLTSSLNAFSLALGHVSRIIQEIVPIGIFVVAANTAGTMTYDRLLELQVFLVTSIGFCLLLAFFVLPLLVSSVTPFRFRDLLSLSSGAVILGATTTNDFITLPLITEGVQNLYAKQEMNEKLTKEVKTYSEVLTPMVYGFPSLGGFMAIFFVLFVAWFYMSPLQLGDSLKLLFAGIPTIFGPATISIPFLLSIMHLPTDAFELYLSARPIQIHFLVALVVMSFFSCTTVCVASLTNQVRIKWKRLLLSVLLIAAVFTVAIAGLHSGFSLMLDNSEQNAQMVKGMTLQDTNSIWLGNDYLETVVFRNAADVPHINTQQYGSALERIRSRNSLRVGYAPDILAFSFFNQNDSLVGYDVQMAKDLARFLGVSRLELVPIEYDSMADRLNEGYCDIIMSAVSVTPQRLKEMDFTRQYMLLHPALVVHDWRTKEFKSLKDVQSMRGLKIAVLKGTEDVRTASILFPYATLIKLDSYEEFFRGDRGDALFDTAEEGSVLALLHPYYAVAMLESSDGTDLGITDSYAYPIARNNNQTLLSHLNYWLDLEESHGGLIGRYNYWILGKNVQKTSPRWSVARDILHWTI